MTLAEYAALAGLTLLGLALLVLIVGALWWTRKAREPEEPLTLDPRLNTWLMRGVPPDHKPISPPAAPKAPGKGKGQPGPRKPASGAPRRSGRPAK